MNLIGLWMASRILGGRVNTYLARWARKKYKRLRSFKRFRAWWTGLLDRNPGLFRHWAWQGQFCWKGFGAPGTGAYVVKFAWTDIVRHILVKGGASPDDPELARYWADRRRKVKPPLDSYTMRLLAKQDARCPLCGDHLLLAGQPPEPPGQWERWWLQLARKAISTDYLAHHGRPGPPDDDQTRLVHASCHRGHLARQRRSTAQRT